MSAYHYEKLPGEPILIYVATENYVLARHLQPSIAEARQHLDALTEPVFYINDLSKQRRLGVTDLLVSANALTRGEKAPYRHPMVRRLLIVTTDPVLGLAFKGAFDPIFGNLQSEIFDTLEAALKYARSFYQG